MKKKSCSRKVNRGGERWDDWQWCGRPAVKDGLCKLHLGVRDRRIARTRGMTLKTRDKK